jgi:exopolysaccharide production protein ExoZ
LCLTSHEPEHPACNIDFLTNTVERSQFLQLMRFVAAALVLCTHATFYYHERISAAVQVWHFGEIGVPIFFVISGIVMVVATQKLPNNAEGARLFMLRRIVRIVPLWWVALTVKVVIALVRPEVVNHNFFQVDYALKSYLFIPYFNELHAVVPLHGVGWTLLHEIYFYILFSLAMWWGLRPAIVASAAIIAMFVLGQTVAVDSPFWAVATHSSNLYFVVGMVVGSAMVLGPTRQGLRRGVTVVLAVAALVLFALQTQFDVHYAYPIVLAVGAAALMCANLQLPTWLNYVGRLGDSSYSLYLFHPFVAPAGLLVLGRVVPSWSAAAHIGTAVLFTVAVAHALHLWVEVPVVRWARDKLLGAPSPVGQRATKHG